MSKDLIRHYTEEADEDGRLRDGIGPFEYERTRDIIETYLEGPQQVIADVGGGTGAYAFRLAERGHQVHFVDLVPRHVGTVEQSARARSLDGISTQVADARSLPFCDDSVDLVLLLGPLYHLIDREDRLRALGECKRVVRKGGRVLCGAISRFASMLAGFRFSRFDDPEFEAMVDRDLTGSQHRNPVAASRHLSTAFLHRPNELRYEIVTSGLLCEKVLGVESPVALVSQLEDWIQEKDRMYRLAVKYSRLVEEEESLVGASFHLIGVAVRP
jgi:SAM-dependent methyltransferase